ncbi:MAG TPA: ribosome assembly RNA-binding protein YhbY [Steroidobacteraceae bacterium]
MNERQLKHLRRLAHPRRPIVTVGTAGLNDAVIEELERALTDHELLKVRVRCDDRAERDNVIEELTRRTRSTLVQRVGHVAVLYRPDAKLPRILLPDA